MVSSSGISALPIFPPKYTCLPCFSRNFEISVVVVVLPFDPVTAIILDGQNLKNTSISVVTFCPLSMHSPIAEF